MKLSKCKNHSRLETVTSCYDNQKNIYSLTTQLVLCCKRMNTENKVRRALWVPAFPRRIGPKEAPLKKLKGWLSRIELRSPHRGSPSMGLKIVSEKPGTLELDGVGTKLRKFAKVHSNNFCSGDLFSPNITIVPLLLVLRLQGTCQQQQLLLQEICCIRH